MKSPSPLAAALAFALGLSACSESEVGRRPDAARDAVAEIAEEDVAVEELDAAEADAVTEEDAGVEASVDAGDGAITLGVTGDGGLLSPPSWARPSPGVGAPDPCAAGAMRPTTGDVVRTITSAGGVRWFYLHVPEGYNGSARPLVLNFHGFSSDPFQQSLLSQMNAPADRRNVIVAYPAGLANSWNAGQCCGASAWVTRVDDVQFVKDTIDAISREYCVDTRRVFSTGMSNGGFLTHRLACEMSDRIAAVAPVAGVLGSLPCSPRRPVPLLHFHGTLDGLVPYYGGGSSGFIAVPASNAGWQLRESCAGLERTTYERSDSRCVERQGCAGGSEVILCTVTGGGHTWPGGTPIPLLGATTTNLDATGMMLDFFERHPLP